MATPYVCVFIHLYTRAHRLTDIDAKADTHICRVTQLEESCHAYKCVMTHIMTHMNTYEHGMSEISVSVHT